MPTAPDRQTVGNTGQLAERFRRFATHEAAGSSPLYERLSLGIAEDSHLLELASHARPGQPVANLLFAAVRFLLLSGIRHPLAAYYPDLLDSRSTPMPLGDPYPSFRAFCLQHRDGIRSIIATRIVQTNEVRRCACLLPAFGRVAEQVGHAPLALIEIGASAGLNLLWDRYKYTYRIEDGVDAARAVGVAGVAGSARYVSDPDAPVRLTCAVRGQSSLASLSLLDPLPRVATRVGLDLNPLDVRDDGDMRWLQALIWPEHVHRVESLRRAVDAARRDPSPILAGDALDLLPGVLQRLPGDAAAGVYHTFTLNQWPPDARARLAALLLAWSAQRTLYRIAIEWLGTDEPQLTLTTYATGTATERLLATCDSHGASIRFL